MEIDRVGDRGLSRREQVIQGELIGRPVMPRAVERATTYGVAMAAGRGAVQRARVQSAAYVAEESLYYLERLEAEETAAATRDPMNAGHRQRRLVNRFVSVAEDAISVAGGRG
jgi:hypothetical protein